MNFKEPLEQQFEACVWGRGGVVLESLSIRQGGALIRDLSSFRAACVIGAYYGWGGWAVYFFFCHAKQGEET